MICTIEIDSVPTGGKKDLGAQTVGAGVGRDEVGFTFVGAETGEGDSSRGKIGAARALGAIASQHAEASGKGGKGVVRGALEVIDCHAAVGVGGVAGNRNGLEGSIFHVHVQLGSPVVGEIFLLGMSWSQRGLEKTGKVL
jgi:hypothetical protein